MSRCRQFNPVHERDGKWYFWDETWAFESVPFDTEALADEALQTYCEKLYAIEDKENRDYNNSITAAPIN